jgi:hypothetical protein
MISFFSAENGLTGSRLCSGKAMVLHFYTSGSAPAEDISGREILLKQKPSHGNSSNG